MLGIVCLHLKSFVFFSALKTENLICKWATMFDGKQTWAELFQSWIISKWRKGLKWLKLSLKFSIEKNDSEFFRVVSRLERHSALISSDSEMFHFWYGAVQQLTTSDERWFRADSLWNGAVQRWIFQFWTALIQTKSELILPQTALFSADNLWDFNPGWILLRPIMFFPPEYALFILRFTLFCADF